MGAKKLSNMQLELLKLFSFDLSQEQLSEIKFLLQNYFAKNVSSEIDKLFEENNWGLIKYKSGLKSICGQKIMIDECGD